MEVYIVAGVSILLLAFIISIVYIIVRVCCYRSPTQDSKNILIGKVIKVPDGDGFTLSKNKKEFKIRIAGIDAPEVAAFGRPGQPFAKNSKLILQGLIEGAEVKVNILRNDRYGRYLCSVKIKWEEIGGVFEDLGNINLKKAISLIEDMVIINKNGNFSVKKRKIPLLENRLNNKRTISLLKSQYKEFLGSKYGTYIDLGTLVLILGIAVVYHGSDAHYAGNETLYKELEKKAKKMKLGVFSLKDFESPMDYKKRYRK